MYLYCKKSTRFILLIPTLIIFIIFTLYPVVDSIASSLTDRYYLAKGNFIGFKNYLRLFQDDIFLNSMKNTAIIVIGILVFVIPLSYLLGTFLTKPYRGSGVFKLIAFLPYVISGIMSALIWLFILDPNMGIINAFLKNVGLESWQQMWIGGKVLTPYSVVLIDVWKNMGFYSVLFMSGIKMMPKDCLEAAHIDGATTWQRTVYVTIPMLKETIKTAAVMLIIAGVNSFNTVRILTGGGPVMLSHTMASYTYYVDFTSWNTGYGSALAVVILGIVMLLSIGVLGVTRKNVDE